jgi:hypothetical protein
MQQGIPGLSGVLLIVLLASCATRIPIADGLESEQLLPAGALVYARLEGAMIGQIMSGLAGESVMKQASDLLERTESAVLAIMPDDWLPPEVPDARTGNKSGNPAQPSAVTGRPLAVAGQPLAVAAQPSAVAVQQPVSQGQQPGAAGRQLVMPALPPLYAVARGAYPVAAIAFRLDIDRAWIRDGPGWTHRTSGLRAAFSSDRRLLIGTASLAAITTPTVARRDNTNPIPAIWHEPWRADLALYLPDPLAVLAKGLPFETVELPLVSMLISAQRLDEGLIGFMGFEFATERSALIFAPLCRLFMLALARGIWPNRASVIQAGIEWRREGPIVAAHNMVLHESELDAFLALLLRP